MFYFAKLYICKRVDKMRKKIILICEECLSRNYSVYKNKDDQKRFQVKKYCKRCDKHTVHKESK
jgi:large subunit ribosomal protein L33